MSDLNAFAQPMSYPPAMPLLRPESVRPADETWRDKVANGLHWFDQNYLGGAERRSPEANRVVSGIVGSTGTKRDGFGLIDLLPYVGPGALAGDIADYARNGAFLHAGAAALMGGAPAGIRAGYHVARSVADKAGSRFAIEAAAARSPPRDPIMVPRNRPDGHIGGYDNTEALTPYRYPVPETPSWASVPSIEAGSRPKFDVSSQPARLDGLPIPGREMYTAHDASGKQLGDWVVVSGRPGNRATSPFGTTVESSKTNAFARRSGVASEVYDRIAADAAARGETFGPSSVLLDPGFAFWKARDPYKARDQAEAVSAHYGRRVPEFNERVGEADEAIRALEANSPWVRR